MARFYPSNAVAQLDAQYGVGGWRISGLALKLMTSDNVAGPGLFNAPGNAGKFNVSWMPVDGGWVQGGGYINQGASSHDPAAYPENFTNLTYNSLQSILRANPAVVLDTLDFVKQGILAPATYLLAGTNQAFLSALMNAQPTTLLFTAADDHVAFNFTSHLYGDDRATNLYSAAILVSASPLPPPTAEIESSGNACFLTFHFKRTAGVTNLTYTVEETAELNQIPWTLVACATNGTSMAGTGLVGETDSDTAGIRDVVVRCSVPTSAAAKRFLRLRITK